MTLSRSPKLFTGKICLQIRNLICRTEQTRVRSAALVMSLTSDTHSGVKPRSSPRMQFKEELVTVGLSPLHPQSLKTQDVSKRYSWQRALTRLAYMPSNSTWWVFLSQWPSMTTYCSGMKRWKPLYTGNLAKMVRFGYQFWRRQSRNSTEITKCWCMVVRDPPFRC